MSKSPNLTRRSLRSYDKVRINQELLHNDVENDEQMMTEEEEEEEDGEERTKDSSHKSNLYPSLDQMKRLDKEQNIRQEKKRKTTEKQKKIKAKNIQKEDSSSSNFYKILFFICFCLALCYSYLKYVIKDSPTLHDNYRVFQTEFTNFTEKYKHVLPVNGIKVLKKSVEPIITREDSSPAVILLISYEQQQDIVKCLTDDFLSTIRKAYKENSTKVIDGSIARKNDIINAFKESFEINKYHTVLVDHLELIPPNDVMVFHQFTDHSNARYTDAIIVLTLYSNNKLDLNNNANFKDMDKIAFDILDKLWMNEWDDNQRSALMSRLTPSVVTVLDNDVSNKIKCTTEL